MNPPSNASSVSTAKPDDRIIVRCTCGQRLAASASQAGRSIRCPKCQSAIVVPKQRESTSATTVAHPAQAFSAPATDPLAPADHGAGNGPFGFEPSDDPLGLAAVGIDPKSIDRRGGYANDPALQRAVSGPPGSSHATADPFRQMAQRAIKDASEDAERLAEMSRGVAWQAVTAGIGMMIGGFAGVLVCIVVIGSIRLFLISVGSFFGGGFLILNNLGGLNRKA